MDARGRRQVRIVWRGADGRLRAKWLDKDLADAILNRGNQNANEQARGDSARQ